MVLSSSPSCVSPPPLGLKRPRRHLLTVALALGAALLLPAGGSRLARAEPSACAAKIRQIYDSNTGNLVAAELSLPALRRLPSAGEWGPHLEIRLGLQGRRAPESLETLTVGQYNLLDLVAGEKLADGAADAARLAGAPLPPWAKPERDVLGVAETILRADPDVLVVEEVGSAEILAEFSRRHLKDRYEPVLIEGNGGGIHIGFLLKKDLPFDVEAQSFKNVATSAGTEPLFSRDLPVLVFRERGGDARGPPRFALAGTHFKSQRTSNPATDTGAIRREQAEAAAEILAAYRKTLGPDAPILLAGDFNEDLRHAPAFDSLRNRAGLRDSFDLAPASKSVDPRLRTTQTFHPRDGSPTVHSQLDAILISGVSPELGVVREAQVVPYLDSRGNIKPVPATIEQRHENPSDHFMIRTVLDYRKMRTPRASVRPTATTAATATATPPPGP